jgi:acetyltransferase-like isoleucine patch superfamily enzyme
MNIIRFFLHAIIFLIASLMKLAGALSTIFSRIWYPARLSADIHKMDLSVQCDGRVYAQGTRNVRIGKRCRVGRDTEFETAGQGRIVLGEDVRINRGCTLVSYSEISIGDFAIIGEYVTIRDANHGMNRTEPMRYQKHTSEPIRIGRDVWIGRGSCVLPGVTIGEGAVIGANSVVTRDIHPFAVVAGAPAQVIKTRD